ncbi:hypothetical protein PCE31107_01737 [Pandoraea cepalis]|uniref:Uncharacterized protein n=1 Tax=Pandoraea cepalis TaxID=2508294 RepID=A0A5E4U001_9BURK|nr:hypothetical protein PCE31107_01737 [Pandoraea cepalis]
MRGPESIWIDAGHDMGNVPISCLLYIITVFHFAARQNLS